MCNILAQRRLLIFPDQTMAHRALLKETAEDDGEDNGEASSTVSLSLSSFGGALKSHRQWDLSCQTGIDEYLASNHGTKITKGNMAGSGFARRFDGRYHSTVKAPSITRCQYCYYIWKHTMNVKEQETLDHMEQNRQFIFRCLVCNVNLCPNCINEWHGVDMRDTNKLFRR